MIPFNLVGLDDSRHPLNGKYGEVVANSRYRGYPLTLVDNTRDFTLCLLHLTEDVRAYTWLEPNTEYRNIGFGAGFRKREYRMYPYEKETISTEKAISVLQQLLYMEQPKLQSRSSVGWTSGRVEDDPNYYGGTYILNDEEEYTILKCREKYKLFKGKRSYYPDWKTEEGLLHAGTLDMVTYKLALEVEEIRKDIVTETSRLLDGSLLDTVKKYEQLRRELHARVTELA